MIVFTHELFAIQNYGGVTRCMIELMRALQGQRADWQVWAGRHGNVPLNMLAEETAADRRVIGTFVGKLQGRRHATIAGEWHLSRHLARQPRAIVHRTQYPVLDLTPRRHARVATLHDMWTEQPGASRGEQVRSRFKRRALEASDAIICVSENSRAELIAAWPHLESRAVTIHHGVRPVSTTPAAMAQPWPFFLFVGFRGPKKNLAVVLRALAGEARLAPFHLVCVGGGPLRPDEHEAIERLGLTGRIHQTIATDDELAGLYAGARALLYPSRHEGFGMPMLEAMLHDCPVISSPCSCLPEIAGDAALYCDPDRPDAWAAAMERIAFSDDEAAALRERGHARVTAFTWEENARRHMDVYRQL